VGASEVIEGVAAFLAAFSVPIALLTWAYLSKRKEVKECVNVCSRCNPVKLCRQICRGEPFIRHLVDFCGGS